MSVARHHAEWLSLIEASGPFLSMPVLLRALPDGLDERADGAEHRVRLRAAHEEWLDNQGGLTPDPAIHRAWARFVIREALEIENELVVEGQAIPASCVVTVAEHQERLTPDLVIVDPPGRPSAGSPRVLITIVPNGQRLDSPMVGVRWKASPATRMMTVLHGASRLGSRPRLGLVTNGEQWMLVHAAPGETTTYASFYASLFIDEPLTLRAFSSLLGSRRSFAVPDTDTLEALFSESSANQQELTDQLGAQVRRAVEVLIQTIDRIDRDRGRQLLRGVDEKVLYEAAVTVMMRLVFLFAAEERDLLLLGDPLFDQNYAVSTLRDQLQTVADQHGEEVLKRRHDAWSRLLATFRAVFGGVRHESMRLPAYGGSLFDPDRFPFLEGRPPGSSWYGTTANPLAIDNLTVLDLLSSLQLLRVNLAGGGQAEARRLSFRALDVEQIGHVYEGLLDHTAKRAVSPVLSLKGGKNLEPEVELTRLEEISRRGADAVIEFLFEETGRSRAALQKAVAYEIDADDRRRFMRACDNQHELYERVEPWAGLVREDIHGDPVIFDGGAVYVTDGVERRATGTHYTPKALTEPIVQYALEPIVYDGPSQGWPREQWKLRSAKQILALGVCDIAMGSGAFLVQACRYLAERLVEAWEAAEAAAGGRLVITPEGDVGTGGLAERALPSDLDERLAMARRYVADRCLYGVDKNPMAVEMAKLSLWLVTLQKDRPFTFVDHALRCGDSLLGLTAPGQIEHFHMDADRGRRLHNTTQGWTAGFGDALRHALALREQIEKTDVTSARDVREKERLLVQAESALSDARLIADNVISAALATAGQGDSAVDNALVNASRLVQERVASAKSADVAGTERSPSRPPPMLSPTHTQGVGRPFHWVLEFPEILGRSQDPGFDAIVANPPFVGGQRITGLFGTDYRDFLVQHIAAGVRGSADLSAYFVLRAANLLRHDGLHGFIATNTIAQGDTREVGLDRLTSSGFSIVRAESSRPWPGAANLQVAIVWLRRGPLSGAAVLDGAAVDQIGPRLTALEVGAKAAPHRLRANDGLTYQGPIVLGTGFLLDEEEMLGLVRDDSRNREVLYPYLGGEDVNARPLQDASRWAINFRDWPLARAGDYASCLEIVRTRVKPERERNNREIYRKYWWHYGEKRPALYSRIRGFAFVDSAETLSPPLDHVLVGVLHTKYWTVSTVSARQVFSHALVVFVDSAPWRFCVLNSSIHEVWARAYSGSLETRLRYSPTDCHSTFAYPELTSGAQAALELAAERLKGARAAAAEQLSMGLTAVYNCYHDPARDDSVLRALRDAQVSVDETVLWSFGWPDLSLGHAFRETSHGLRFTISEGAGKAILDRLLELNHRRYEDERLRGLHDEKRPKPAKKAASRSPPDVPVLPPVRAAAAQARLFDDDGPLFSTSAKRPKR